MKKTRTSLPTAAAEAQQVLDRIRGDDPKLRHAVATAELHLIVAEEIYAARTAAGLSQAQLAKLVGTTQSAIARLEDADYGGHSLTMLERIAAALGRRVEIRLVRRRGQS